MGLFPNKCLGLQLVCACVIDSSLDTSMAFSSAIGRIGIYDANLLQWLKP